MSRFYMIELTNANTGVGYLPETTSDNNLNKTLRDVERTWRGKYEVTGVFLLIPKRGTFRDVSSDYDVKPPAKNRPEEAYIVIEGDSNGEQFYGDVEYKWSTLRKTLQSYQDESAFGEAEIVKIDFHHNTCSYLDDKHYEDMAQEIWERDFMRTQRSLEELEAMIQEYNTILADKLYELFYDHKQYG